MIISIDNRKATEVQKEFIKVSKCIRCHNKIGSTNKRVVFVELSSGEILAWHGLKNVKGGVFECNCTPLPREEKQKQERQCLECRKKYFSKVRIRFCSQPCEKKYFHKNIYVLK